MNKKKSAFSRVINQIGMFLGSSRAADNGVSDLYSTYNTNEVPSTSSLTTIFSRCRTIVEDNYWINRFIENKINVMNYGLSLSPGVNKKANTKTENASIDDINKLDEWLASSVEIDAGKIDQQDIKTLGIPSATPITYQELIERFIEDSWKEFIKLDSVIAFWSDSSPFPVTLPPESCRYTDKFGVETLFYTHGMSKSDLKLLPPDEQKTFMENESIISEIPIDGGKGEFFKVLKSERVGFGLSVPGIYSIFRAAGASESMEISESSYAFSGRMKFRHHKVGHAISYGPMAGKNTYFWKPERSKSIRGIFSDKLGFLGDYISNFDHTLEYPHEDISFFDEKKWKSVEHRFVEWGGPLAVLLTPEAKVPFSFTLLAAEAKRTRRKMKMFLETVINLAFKAPCPIQITWSNLIFNDPTILQQYLKDGTTLGAVSHHTWRDVVGFDEEREQQRLKDQADDVAANPSKYSPPYDPAHGATSETTSTKTTNLNRGGRGKKNDEATSVTNSATSAQTQQANK